MSESPFESEPELNSLTQLKSLSHFSIFCDESLSHFGIFYDESLEYSIQNSLELMIFSVSYVICLYQNIPNQNETLYPVQQYSYLIFLLNGFKT